MKTVADVNVLFATVVEGHAHHSTAWRWWEQAADHFIALCWPTRMAVLRLLTNPKAMNGRAVVPGTALAAWDALAIDPRTFWSDPVPGLDAYFRHYVAGRQPSPNLWADAWLASHAESLGFRLTSFDADFRAFGLSHFEHLLPR
jgi:toxin-antitoxin system PIN domain toxin